MTLERRESEERVKQEREELEEEERTKREQEEEARQKAIEEELQPQSTAVAGRIRIEIVSMEGVEGYDI